MPFKCIVCKERRPSFNFPGRKDRTHCSGCKLDRMVDVVNKKCVVCGIKVPYFGYPGQKRATYCGDCKLENMTNIKGRKCIVCNEKRPCFNLEGIKKPTHCASCKTQGMINVSGRKCIVCKKQYPYMNFEGSKEASHCGKCKTEGMVSVVKSKKFCLECKMEKISFIPNVKNLLYCQKCEALKSLTLEEHQQQGALYNEKMKVYEQSIALEKQRVMDQEILYHRKMIGVIQQNHPHIHPSQIHQGMEQYPPPPPLSSSSSSSSSSASFNKNNNNNNDNDNNNNNNMNNTDNNNNDNNTITSSTVASSSSISSSQRHNRDSKFPPPGPSHSFLPGPPHSQQHYPTRILPSQYDSGSQELISSQHLHHLRIGGHHPSAGIYHPSLRPHPSVILSLPHSHSSQPQQLNPSHLYTSLAPPPPQQQQQQLTHFLPPPSNNNNNNNNNNNTRRNSSEVLVYPPHPYHQQPPHSFDYQSLSSNVFGMSPTTLAQHGYNGHHPTHLPGLKPPPTPLRDAEAHALSLSSHFYANNSQGMTPGHLYSSADPYASMRTVGHNGLPHHPQVLYSTTPSYLLPSESQLNNMHKKNGDVNDLRNLKGSRNNTSSSNVNLNENTEQLLKKEPTPIPSVVSEKPSSLSSSTSITTVAPETIFENTNADSKKRKRSEEQEQEQCTSTRPYEEASKRNEPSPDC